MAAKYFSLPSAVPCIEDMQTHLTGDQLVVAWQSSGPDVDTWMVEWLPDLESAPLCWEPVSRARHWTIQRGSPCGPTGSP